MMKKTFLMMLPLIFLASIAAANAAVSFNSTHINTTLRFPAANAYNTNDGALMLNVTVYRANNMNITNATFIFTLSSNITRYMNSTINGSRPVQNSESHFTYNLGASALAEGIWNLTVEVRNATEASNTDTSVNTSSVLFVVDRSAGAVVISEPYSGSTVVPNSNVVSFNYMPTETNLGNCSLNLNNQLVKSSTSGTTSPNVTSGANNRFTHEFSNDNLSVRLAVRCIDLAGVGTSSNSLNNFTFNVLTGAISPAIRQAQIAASGGGGGFAAQQQQAQKPAFSAASSAAQGTIDYSTHLQKWAWAYVIGIVVIAGIAIRKYYK